MQHMTLRILRIFPIAALMVLFAVGTFYAQEHAEHNAKHANAKSDVPEIYCSHLGTGQLCPGNADMFKLNGAKKQAYLEALNSYNKAVAAASKQFAADAKAKAGLSEVDLSLVESWFAEGLNPEINKILATKSKK
jgi:hypothetical protein